MLFVDYIAEHLNPGGRAGIIVPEGIIAQTQNTYKALRKMLVEDYLWAVVSLPTGVFNPYSSVKTCILFLDRNLAKRADRVLFVKVENDGFHLGAQRQSIEGTDLPAALKAIATWKNGQRMPKAKIALFVARKRLLESPDCNLSGDRYREVTQRGNGKWPMVPLGDLCDNRKDAVTPSEHKGVVNYIGLENIESDTGRLVGEFRADIKSIKSTKLRFGRGDVLYGKLRPNLNKVWLAEIEGICSTDIMVLRFNRDFARPELFASLLREPSFNAKILQGLAGAQLPRVRFSHIATLEVPLPPLAEQEQLVAELDVYRKVIEGGRQTLGAYRPQLPQRPDWPVVELREAIEAKPKNGYSGKPVSYTTDLKVLALSATTSGRLDITRFKFLDEKIPQDSPCRCRRGDIYLQRGNTKELVGTAALFDVDDTGFIYPDLMIRVRADERRVIPEFLLHSLQSKPVREFVTRNAGGAAGNMPKINQQIVERIPIALPPLAEQRRIVAELAAEQKFVDGNRELITRMEKQIQARLAEIWGETSDRIPPHAEPKDGLPEGKGALDHAG